MPVSDGRQLHSFGGARRAALPGGQEQPRSPTSPDDGGALPLACRGSLRARPGRVADQDHHGRAGLGRREAVSVHNALLAYVLHADAAVVIQGPGNLG